MIESYDDMDKSKNKITKSDTAIKNDTLLIVFMIFCLMKPNNNNL